MTIKLAIDTDIHKIPVKKYHIKDVPSGYGIYSDMLSTVLIPIDDIWIGFASDSMGLVDDDRQPIQGQLVKLSILVNTKGVRLES